MTPLGYGTLEENLEEETVEDKSGKQNVVSIPKEPFKTFLSGLFLLSGFLATTISLSVIHDHVPLTPSLPDEVLDHVGYLSWGLTASEAILVINVLMAVTVVILHHHRLIILRRVWFLLGLLYYYRSITMFVTILPKPDKNYKCMVEEDHVTFFIIVKRVLHIISGGGLSVNGKHVYCGDYIFSGHTFTLVMAYLVIRECIVYPKNYYYNFFILTILRFTIFFLPSPSPVPGAQPPGRGVPAVREGSLHH